MNKAKYVRCLCTEQLFSFQLQFSGGSKGGGRPNSFNFMQFLGKYGKIVCWRPPGELAPPPRGNPGSATAIVVIGQCTQLVSLVIVPSCGTIFLMNISGKFGNV